MYAIVLEVFTSKIEYKYRTDLLKALYDFNKVMFLGLFKQHKNKKKHIIRKNIFSLDLETA